MSRTGFNEPPRGESGTSSLVGATGASVGSVSWRVTPAAYLPVGSMSIAVSGRAAAPSVPEVRLPLESVRVLHPHHTEHQASGVAQNPPALDLLHPLGAERLESLYLCFDVVGFDVEVNASGSV